jgi:hypothetical protein
VEFSEMSKDDGRLYLTRRGLLQLAGAGYLGLNLGGLWRAQAAHRREGRTQPAAHAIKSCILIFYYGGPSHLDTFDLKPTAPAEVRGEFKPIRTSVPGLHVCEHLPRMARLMHKVALVRSVHHSARLHDSASIHALTGRPLDGPDRELFSPQPQFYPSFGSAVAYLNRHPSRVVPFASLPYSFRNVHDVPCQGGGLLGAAYNPLQVEVDPARRAYSAEQLRPAQELSSERLRLRRSLLHGLESQRDPGQGRSAPFHDLYEKAYTLLDSVAIRRALDITQESPQVRERYGFGAGSVAVGEGGGGGNGAELAFARQMRGQHLLLARRLVEAGVPFVNVYDFKQQGQNWDAHFKVASQHKNYLLPQADQALSALLEDLDARGLLDSTLVVAMGEFGRTPRINHEGGRDHWPDCYTVLLAGGGVRGGAVYGSSDRIGAYPATDPVTPGDLAATIFWRFGLDPAIEIYDPMGRPHRLATGEPIRKLFSA